MHGLWISKDFKSIRSWSALTLQQQCCIVTVHKPYYYCFVMQQVGVVSRANHLATTISAHSNRSAQQVHAILFRLYILSATQYGMIVNSVCSCILFCYWNAYNAYCKKQSLQSSKIFIATIICTLLQDCYLHHSIAEIHVNTPVNIINLQLTSLDTLTLYL